MGPSSFRKWYGHVCEIRSFLPCNTPVLALTATATTLTCSTIIKHLNMREPHMIQMSPNRRYSVVNTSREATEAFQWLVEELGRLRRALPCVIVFCWSITTCSKLYKFFLTELHTSKLLEDSRSVQKVHQHNLSREHPIGNVQTWGVFDKSVTFHIQLER